MFLRRVASKIIPKSIVLEYQCSRFDRSKTIYNNRSFNDYLTEFYPLIVSKREAVDSGKVQSDILRSFFKYGVRPDEYYLYNYIDIDNSERNSYLSQRSKDRLLIDYYGPKWGLLLSDLKDKYSFYKYVSPYFKRDVICVKNNEDFDAFESFLHNHSSVFAKQISGYCGLGARVIDNSSHSRRPEDIFNELLQDGEWILEETIQQDSSLAQFNPTSINTIRFPSFRHGNIVNPVFPCLRVGRYGSIVDNAGRGGVFVSVDKDSGIIVSDAFDERGNMFKTHPDSNICFKGFPIPKWNELLDLIVDAHLSLPSRHVYVAFDVALSNKGWCIVEGNWGDFVLQQVSLQRGLKKEFRNYLGSFV